jgi:hypothetical protein
MRFLPSSVRVVEVIAARRRRIPHRFMKCTRVPTVDFDVGKELVSNPNAAVNRMD